MKHKLMEASPTPELHLGRHAHDTKMDNLAPESRAADPAGKQHIPPVNPRKSFLGVLEANVHRLHSKVLYAWMKPNGEVGLRLTYRQVWTNACNIAKYLANRRDVLKGDRVVLCYTFGLDFIQAFVGCLIAGVIPVPIYPPNPSRLLYSVKKMKYVIENCAATLLLTHRDFSKNIWKIKLKIGQSNWPRIYTIDTNSLKDLSKDEMPMECQGQTQDWNPSDPTAFLQFTSGSTSDPKGVMISFSNLVHQMNLSNAIWNRTTKPIPNVNDGELMRPFCWLPQYHDFGLINNYLFVFFHGSIGHFMSPFEFVKNPSLWINGIWSTRSNYSPTPNFALGLALRKWKEKKISPNFSLSHFIAFNVAGEENQRRLFEEFEDFFSKYGLRRNSLLGAYGMAEHVVGVSINIHNNQNSKIDPRRVCCGYIDGTMGVDVRIVDPNTRLEVGKESNGEIWVRSGSVAKGYWGLPVKSKETFRAEIKNYDEMGENSWLRSGDIGYMEGNSLFFVSRLKDIMVIRGRNIAPRDIELYADKVDKIRIGCSACFSVKNGDTEGAVLVSELKSTTESSEELRRISRSLRSRVASGEGINLLDLVLIYPKSLPKTSSGKIRRSKAKEMYSNRTLKALYWRSQEAISRDISDPLSPFGVGNNAEIREICDEKQFRAFLTLRIDPSFDWNESGTSDFSGLIDSVQLFDLIGELNHRFGIIFNDPLILLELTPQILVELVAKHCEYHCSITNLKSWTEATRDLPRTKKAAVNSPRRNEAVNLESLVVNVSLENQGQAANSSPNCMNRSNPTLHPQLSSNSNETQTKDLTQPYNTPTKTPEHDVELPYSARPLQFPSRCGPSMMSPAIPVSPFGFETSEVSSHRTNYSRDRDLYRNRRRRNSLPPTRRTAFGSAGSPIPGPCGPDSNFFPERGPVERALISHGQSSLPGPRELDPCHGTESTFKSRIYKTSGRLRNALASAQTAVSQENIILSTAGRISRLRSAAGPLDSRRKEKSEEDMLQRTQQRIHPNEARQATAGVKAAAINCDINRANPQHPRCHDDRHESVASTADFTISSHVLIRQERLDRDADQASTMATMETKNSGVSFRTSMPNNDSEKLKSSKSEVLEREVSWWIRLLVQLLGVWIMLFLGAISALLPYHVVQYIKDCTMAEDPWLEVNIGIYSEATINGILVLFVLPLWATCFSVAVVAMKWIVIGRYRPGTHRIFGWYWLRWWFVDRLLALWEVLVGNVISESIFLITFYKLLGAKINFDNSIGGFLREHDLVHIHKSSVVNGKLLTRSISPSQLVLRSIVIGSECIISKKCIVEGGSMLMDGVWLFPLTFIPTGSQLSRNTVWIGNPAERVDSLEQLSKRIRGSKKPVSDHDFAQLRAHKPAASRLDVCLEVSKVVSLILLPQIFNILSIPGVLLFWYIDLFDLRHPGIPGTRQFRQDAIISDLRYLPLVYFVLVWTTSIALFPIYVITAKWIMAGHVKSGLFRNTLFTTWRRWYLHRVNFIVNFYSFAVLCGRGYPIYMIYHRLLGVKVGKAALHIDPTDINPEDAHLVSFGQGSAISLCAISCISNLSHPNGCSFRGRINFHDFSAAGLETSIAGACSLGKGSMLGWLTHVGSLPGPGGEFCMEDNTSLVGSTELRSRKSVDYKLDRAPFCRKAKFVLFDILLSLLRFALKCGVILLTYEAGYEIQSKISNSSVKVTLWALYIGIWVCLMCVYVVVTKKILIGRYRVSVVKDVWSTFLLRWAHVSSDAYVFQSLINVAISGTSILNCFLCLQGAQVALDAVILGHVHLDNDLIQIGSRAVVDEGARVFAHVRKRAVFKHRKTIVGNAATVGAGSYMNAGDCICAKGVLMSLSKCFRGTTICPHQVWTGVPAQRS